MAKKRIISLSVDSKVYEEFSKKCRQEGIIISRQVEKFMEQNTGGENR